MTDLDALEKLAREATPGPWRVDHAGHGLPNGGFLADEVYVYAPECGVDDVAIAADIADPLTGKMSESNAAYIAAASPDVVLKMVAVCRAAEAGLAALRDVRHHRDWESQTSYNARADAINGLREALAAILADPGAPV